MAHFAELDENNIVKRVIVVENSVILENGIESESKGIEFCVAHFGGRWAQTSYNTFSGNHRTGGVPFRHNYAGIGFIFLEKENAFIPPKPQVDGVEFILNQETLEWEKIIQN